MLRCHWRGRHGIRSWRANTPNGLTVELHCEPIGRDLVDVLRSEPIKPVLRPVACDFRARRRPGGSGMAAGHRAAARERP